MNTYEKNMHRLSQHAPLLYDLIKKHTLLDTEYQLYTTKKKDLSLRWKNKALHSSYDPHREAQRVMKQHLDDAKTRGSDALVFLGMGLGYYLRAAQTLPNPGLCVVLECDVQILKLFFTHVDADFLFPHIVTKLLVAENPQRVIEFLKLHGIKNPSLICIPALQAGHEAYYKSLEDALRTYLNQQEINTNTLKRFGHLWIRNIIRNKKALQRGRGIEQLAHQFSFTPALICAAGPTLDTLLPSLKDLAERMLLIAVDTTVPLLAERELYPDIVVVVDPQYWNSRHLDRLRLKDSVLVADSSSHPRNFRVLPIPVFFGASIFPLGRLFDPPERPTLGAGGSVVTSAWDLACLLGVSAIYLAGVDLSFPSHRSHAKGTFFEGLWLAESTKMHPLETQLYSYLCSGDLSFTEDYRGNVIQSDKRMQLYRQWLEQKNKEAARPPSYSLSESSISLQGIPHIPPSSCVALPKMREGIERRKKDILSRSVEKSHPALNLTVLKKELSAMKKLIDQALEHVAQLAHKGTPDTSAFEELTRIDEVLFKSPYKDTIGFLIPDAVQKIFQHPDTKDALQNSKVFYTAVRDSLCYHLKFLDKYKKYSA